MPPRVDLRVVARDASSRQRVRLSFAVCADHVTALAVGPSGGSGPACPGYRRVLARALEPRPGDGTWPALATAIVEASAVARATLRARVDAAVCIALLPPLARAKAASLVHRGTSGELLQLPDPAARRLFLVSTDRPVAGGAAILRAAPLAARRGTPADAVVACADAELVEAIAHAVRSAGLRIARVTAASAVLAPALRTVAPTLPEAPLLAVAACGTAWSSLSLLLRGRPIVLLELGRAGDGRTAGLVTRCLAALSHPSDSVDAHGVRAESAALAEAPAERWQVLGVGAHAAGLAGELAAALAGQGGAAEVPVTILSETSAEEAAALGAVVAADAPPLLPPSLWSERAARLRRRGALLCLQGGAAMAAVACLHVWGLARELRAVREARAAERPRVAAALALQTRHERDDTRLRVLAEAAVSRGRWADALGALASALPDRAYVTRVVGQGDELRISGRAIAARSVVPALAAAPPFRRAALLVPIRPATADGSVGLEEFELSLTIARSVAGPTLARGPEVHR